MSAASRSMQAAPAFAARPITEFAVPAGDRVAYAIAAYRSCARLGLSGNSLTVEVLLRSTSLLRGALERWDRDASPGLDLDHALDHAERMWSLLADETAEDQGGSEGSVTFAVLGARAQSFLAGLRAEPNRADLIALIEMNRLGVVRARS